MLWLGLLSVVQIAFLPGYLALRALKLTERPAETLVLSFALSLTLSHLLVVALVLAGCYRPGVLYGVFAVEAVLFAWTARRWPMLTLAELFTPRSDSTPAPSAIERCVAAAAVVLMIAFAAHALWHAGDIFQQWDAVVSWNRWAQDWAGNHLPRTTAEYPQLLPCNMSLSYVFLQDASIWFFAKGFMFLFCLLLLLGMFDLYRRTGQIGYALGVLVTYGLFVALLTVEWSLRRKFHLR